MSLASLAALLATILTLLQSVQANPDVSPAMRDSVLQSAQSAIARATDSLALVQATPPPASGTAVQNQPFISITADNSVGSLIIASSTSATIRWATANVRPNSCKVTGDGNTTGWAGDSNASGVSTGPITVTHTWTLTCTKPDGTPIAQSVKVSPDQAFVSITADNIVGTATVGPTGNATIRWFSAYVQKGSCRITGNGRATGWSGDYNPGYPDTGVSTGLVSETTTWTITCTKIDGTPVSQSVTVLPPATTQSQPSLSITADNYVGSRKVAPGSSATIRWAAGNVKVGSCTVLADGNVTGWPNTEFSPDFPTGGVSTGPINASHTWTLSCKKLDGTSVSASVVVSN